MAQQAPPTFSKRIACIMSAAALLSTLVSTVASAKGAPTPVAGAIGDAFAGLVAAATDSAGQGETTSAAKDAGARTSAPANVSTPDAELESNTTKIAASEAASTPLTALLTGAVQFAVRAAPALKQALDATMGVEGETAAPAPTVAAVQFIGQSEGTKSAKDTPIAVADGDEAEAAETSASQTVFANAPGLIIIPSPAPAAQPTVIEVAQKGLSAQQPITEALQAAAAALDEEVGEPSAPTQKTADGEAASSSAAAADAALILPPDLSKAVAKAAQPLEQRIIAPAKAETEKSNAAGSNPETGTVSNISVARSALASVPKADAPSAQASPVLPTTSTAAAQVQLPVVEVAPATTPAGSTDPAMIATPVGVPIQHSGAPVIALNNVSHLSQTAIDVAAQIAARIIRTLDGRSTRFDMALTPEDLGRVDVNLSIDKDGQIAARMAFDNPLAAAELRGRVDELRRQLEDAGFTVAQDGFDFSERQSGASGDGLDRRQQRAFAGAAQLSGSTEPAVAQPVWMSLSLAPQGVDVKV